MKQLRSICVAIVFTTSFAINSSSQTANNSSPAAAVFVATTPCDDISKSLFHIPSTSQAQMMTWDLRLYHDPKTSAPATFNLVCTYGMPRQGTRGFMDGATTIELKGSWIIDKGTKENSKAVVCKLTADNSPISLLFLRPNENILHLLDANKNLVVGNGAWSYTLNSTKPVDLSSNKINSQKIISENLSYDSAVFDGRTPCYNPLLSLTGQQVARCQLIKCRIVLYRDVNTHEPTNFQLYTVYVGGGDTRYPTVGKWTVLQGTETDEKTVLYQLQPKSEMPQSPLTFMKGDDNILFLLDTEMNCMAGNDYCSFTFNRIRK